MCVYHMANKLDITQITEKSGVVSRTGLGCFSHCGIRTMQRETVNTCQDCSAIVSRPDVLCSVSKMERNTSLLLLVFEIVLLSHLLLHVF